MTHIALLAYLGFTAIVSCYGALRSAWERDAFGIAFYGVCLAIPAALLIAGV